MNTIAYLDFFFANVQGSEGDVFLIKDPKKLPFISALTKEQREIVITNFKPLQVSQNAAANVFRVHGTLYYGGGLISSTILVTEDGKLSFQDQTLLLNGIYFPYSPNSQAWMEG